MTVMTVMTLNGRHDEGATTLVPGMATFAIMRKSRF